jgi:hypothetical protein
MIDRSRIQSRGGLKMGRKNIYTYLTIVLILFITQMACGASTPTETPTPEPPPPTDVPADTPEPTPEPTEAPTVEPTPATAPGYEQAVLFAGRWEGSWTNITFGSTGPVTIEVMIHDDGTADLTVDVGGMVFGAVNPDPATYSGTYDAEGAYFTIMDDPVFGEVVMTISAADNSFTITGELIPDPGIASIEASGMFTEDTVDGEYTVFFAGGGQAVGETTLTKIEE